ncbi:hypothetical protein EDC01DRAFT_784433 [Geopyxis carbonaria]|nr:hypothetical protein EDC01DRAFT_784433 [Geopyxis carbonaria]
MSEVNNIDDGRERILDPWRALQTMPAPPRRLTTAESITIVLMTKSHNVMFCIFPDAFDVTKLRRHPLDPPDYHSVQGMSSPTSFGHPSSDDEADGSNPASRLDSAQLPPQFPTLAQQITAARGAVVGKADAGSVTLRGIFRKLRSQQVAQKPRKKARKSKKPQDSCGGPKDTPHSDDEPGPDN